VKRSPIRRKTPAPARTRGPREAIRKANPKRRRSKFARCYHSRARVAFVKALPCFICQRTPCDNAHTEGLGMGIKAGYDKVIPLCREHHQAYDEHRDPFDGLVYRDAFKAYTAVVEKMWQAKTNNPPSYLHTTDELCTECGASFVEVGDRCASCAHEPPPRDAA